MLQIALTITIGASQSGSGTPAIPRHAGDYASGTDGWGVVRTADSAVPGSLATNGSLTLTSSGQSFSQAYWPFRLTGGADYTISVTVSAVSGPTPIFDLDLFDGYPDNNGPENVVAVVADNQSAPGTFSVNFTAPPDGLCELVLMVQSVDDGATVSEVTVDEIAAPQLIASHQVYERTITVSVDHLTGFPVPAASIAMTLNGSPVSPTGTGPWTYTAADSASGSNIAWIVTATNGIAPDAEESGLAVIPANLFAPAFSVAASISGSALVGETVTLNEGTATGTPAPTLTGALTLNGSDVSGDMVGLEYTLPAGTAGQSLVWTVTATNGIAPDAVSQVSRTVENAEAPGTLTFTETGGDVTIQGTASGPWNFLITGGPYDGETETVTAAEIGVAPRAIGQPRADGTPTAGNDLTAQTGAWLGFDDDGDILVQWDWLRTGAVQASDTPTYAVTAADGGNGLDLEVRATNGAGTRTINYEIVPTPAILYIEKPATMGHRLLDLSLAPPVTRLTWAAHMRFRDLSSRRNLLSVVNVDSGISHEMLLVEPDGSVKIGVVPTGPNTDFSHNFRMASTTTVPTLQVVEGQDCFLMFSMNLGASRLRGGSTWAFRGWANDGVGGSTVQGAIPPPDALDWIGAGAPGNTLSQTTPTGEPFYLMMGGQSISTNGYQQMDFIHWAWFSAEHALTPEGLNLDYFSDFPNRQYIDLTNGTLSGDFTRYVDNSTVNGAQETYSATIEPTLFMRGRPVDGWIPNLDRYPFNSGAQYKAVA